MTETITIGRRTYRKFIPYPQEVKDGTARCFVCGQIDEPDYHDAALCPATGGKLPLSAKAQAFAAANAESPVVFGSAQKNGGAYYRLADGRSFRLSLHDCRSLLAPTWRLPA